MPAPPAAATEQSEPRTAKKPAPPAAAADQAEPRSAEKPAAPATVSATKRAESPPVAVRRAFGVVDPHPLPGGQGTVWLADGLVLKPDEGHVWDWLAPYCQPRRR